jgi:hypothetical protein
MKKIEVNLEEYFRLISKKKGEFATLLASNPLEEEVQQFLNENRFLLVAGLSGFFPTPLDFCLLDFVIIPKLRLGAEYVVDFAVGRLLQFGHSWTLIELESPRSRLFTLSSNPTKELTHAIKQAHEWRSWMSINSHYVAKVLDSAIDRVVQSNTVSSSICDLSERVSEYRSSGGHLINMITCKVIIGRKDSLTKKTEDLLVQMNADYSGNVEIMTYDRLLIPRVPSLSEEELVIRENRVVSRVQRFNGKKK